MRIPRTAAKIGAALAIAASAATLTSAPAHAASGWVCRDAVPNVGPLHLSVQPCMVIYSDHVTGVTILSGSGSGSVRAMVGLNHVYSFYRIETDSWTPGSEDPFYNVSHGNSYNISGGYYYGGAEYGDIQSPVVNY
ncbi:hypothetical protein [Kitasatospora azatica]|uniref:hypothetical protein n=1 Tax=Kitasatospora azatica TaxID=58347 RepID=UPI0005687438|nr:hypothetical protein [Kitasatospora azatica]